MSKITQARARADRRELKDLKAKLYRQVTQAFPGISLRFIPVEEETLGILKVANRLGFDIVYRLDSKESQLTAYAVKRS